MPDMVTARFNFPAPSSSSNEILWVTLQNEQIRKYQINLSQNIKQWNWELSNKLIAKYQTNEPGNIKKILKCQTNESGNIKKNYNKISNK